VLCYESFSLRESKENKEPAWSFIENFRNGWAV
jgi:hypothetical protein